MNDPEQIHAPSSGEPGGSLALTPAASAEATKEALKAEVRKLTVTGPDVQALLTAVSVDLQVVPVTDIDSAELATDMRESLGRLSTVRTAIDDERLERGRVVREVVDWLNAGYNEPIKTIDAVIAGGKEKLTTWERSERDRIRREQEAAAEAQRKAAAEAAAAAAAAEAAANAAAAAAMQQAQALREAGSEEGAAALETQAMVAADTARQNAAQATAVAFARPVSAAGGRGSFKAPALKWKAECNDKAALLAHIGALCAKGDKSLIGLVEIDPKAINKLAELQKADLKVPGLRPYSEEAATRITKVAVAA